MSFNNYDNFDVPMQMPIPIASAMLNEFLQTEEVGSVDVALISIMAENFVQSDEIVDPEVSMLLWKRT